jgi:hypothetical protein
MGGAHTAANVHTKSLREHRSSRLEFGASDSAHGESSTRPVRGDGCRSSPVLGSRTVGESNRVGELGPRANRVDGALTVRDRSPGHSLVLGTGAASAAEVASSVGTLHIAHA